VVSSVLRGRCALVESDPAASINAQRLTDTSADRSRAPCQSPEPVVASASDRMCTGATIEGMLGQAGTTRGEFTALYVHNSHLLAANASVADTFTDQRALHARVGDLAFQGLKDEAAKLRVLHGKLCSVVSDLGCVRSSVCIRWGLADCKSCRPCEALRYEEWAVKCTRRATNCGGQDVAVQASPISGTCPGTTIKSLAHLHGERRGAFTALYVHNMKQLGTNASVAETFTDRRTLHARVGDLEFSRLEDEARELGVLHGKMCCVTDEGRVHSSVCIHGGSSHSELCAPCAALHFEGWTTKAEARAERPVTAKACPQRAKHSSLSRGAALQRVKHSAAHGQDRWLSEKNAERKLLRAQRKIERLESKMCAGISHDKYPKFVRALMAACDEEKLPTSTLQNILEDIGRALVSPRRRVSIDTKSFYTCLLNCGNPWVTQFVSKNLRGLSLSSTKAHRRERSFEFVPGKVAQAMEQAADDMKEYGMEGVPCMFSEDATTCLRRLDAVLKGNLDAGGKLEVHVDGFLEPFSCTSVEDLHAKFKLWKDEGVATYVYVWTLTPMMHNAPYFPTYMVATNNKFDARWVTDWWQFIANEADRCGVELVGFVSDGDARLRRADAELMVKEKAGEWCVDKPRSLCLEGQ
jgi:hypothetical protein